jgi:hypothetical protein
VFDRRTVRLWRKGTEHQHAHGDHPEHNRDKDD